MDRTCERTPASLSDSVQRQLNMYALAAGAAGVSLLALANPAEAKIVYKYVNLRAVNYQLSPLGEVVAPFGIYEAFSAVSTYVYWARESFNPATLGARFMRGGTSSWNVAALTKGAQIDSKAHWGGTRGLMATYGPYGGGTFKHHRGGFQFGRPAFVGFKFETNGKTHYAGPALPYGSGKGPWSSTYTQLLSTTPTRRSPTSQSRPGRLKACRTITHLPGT